MVRGKRRAVLSTLLLVLAGAGCAGHAPESEAAPPRVSGELLEAGNIPAPEKLEDSARTMYVRDDEYRLALYEPTEGCYLGAYILANRAVGFDIAEFEKTTEKPHGLYMYNMSLGDLFPESWLLGCVARMKTPYVALKTKPLLSADEWAALEKTADAFGDFYVPVFVEFNTVDRTVDREDYLATFRRARRIFAERASNVAFVWNVDMADALHCQDYYPGDEYTDWVGINIVETLGPDGTFGDTMNSLDFFYYTFQRRKPIAVSRLAISHMSSRDYVYREEEAAREIERFYGALESGYSRVKAVIYMDFNGIEFPGKHALKDDFTITGQESLLEAYKGAASGGRFVSELDAACGGDVCRALYTSPFDAYEFGGKFYVSRESLTHDLGVPEEAALGTGMTVNGGKYYPAAEVPGVLERVEFRKKRLTLY